MRFLYKIAWVDPSSQSTKYLNIADENIMLYIVKKKIAEGMQGVTIYANTTTNEDYPDNPNWEAIDNPATNSN